jgi:DNA-binding NarL/FixJ family response regulator
MPESALTLVVADDHPSVLRTVTELSHSWGWTIVASTTNPREALVKIEELRPAVAVLDLAMRGLSGLEIATRIRKTAPDTAIVFYSGSRDTAAVREALDVGAQAFVVKEASLDELRRALEAVRRGEHYVDPLVSGLLLTDQRTASVTKREREVLRLLADGDSYEEIASRLFISTETVRTHVAKVVRKLQVRTRTEAVAEALRQGFIS